MAIKQIAIHEAATVFRVPFYSSKIQAGFPSPADDYMDRKLDLNELLIKHPAATYYCQVNGDSMTGVGIYDGVIMAILVIARVYSILVDGVPGMVSLVYLVTELSFAIVFLLWPPPL